MADSGTRAMCNGKNTSGKLKLATSIVSSKKLKDNRTSESESDWMKHRKSPTFTTQMGRAKLRLELICNEKARRITYENRRKSLLKKAKELSTLCGVDLCIILYGPSIKNGAMETTVWPRNQHQVAELIDSYKSSDESHNGLSHEQLKELASILTAKIDVVKARINFMSMSTRIPLTESGVFLNSFSVQENTVFVPRTLDATFEQPNIIHQQLPLSYKDAAQSFFTENERRMMMPTINNDQSCNDAAAQSLLTENERRMMMLTINNDPSCNNNGYSTSDENPENYMYDSIENQFQHCGLGNPKMETDSDFTNADKD